MKQKLIAGQELEMVTPGELQRTLTSHHSNMVDSLVRAQLEGLKVITGKWLCASNSNPWVIPVLEGFILSLLFVSYNYLSGVTPAQVALFISDDPHGTLNINDQIEVGLTGGAFFPLEGANGNFLFSQGQVLIRGGQAVVIAPQTVSAVGGYFCGILVPAEMVGKLYL